MVICLLRQQRETNTGEGEAPLCTGFILWAVKLSFWLRRQSGKG